MAALLPYLDDHWRETVVRRGIEDLTTISYPTRNPLSFRQDWRDETGRTATDVATLGRQALDPFGTRLAICNCLYGVQAQFSEDLGVGVRPRAERLDRAGMAGPRHAAAGVDRRADAERGDGGRRDRTLRPRPPLRAGHAAGRRSENTLGRRQYWPIYAAAERHGLPIGIHAGSMYRHPMTPVGWPTTFTEEYVNQATAFQSQLTSLIAEGVFAKFPALTVVLMESGVTWLPAYLWRLTKFWKGLRSEIPWVSDPPGSIVRDRVRLTLQPFDAPPDPASVMRLIEHIGSDEMLLFSTDYPHYQFDGTEDRSRRGWTRASRRRSWRITRCEPMFELNSKR